MNKERFQSAVLYVIMIFLIIFFYFPIFTLVVTSIQNNSAFVGWNLQNLTLKYWIRALSPISPSLNVFYGTLNSLIVSGVSTLVSLAITIFAAYALTAFRFKSRKAIAYFILGLSFFPTAVTIVPLYLFAYTLKLYDTYIMVILVYVLWSIPLSTWMLRSFIREVPVEISEAALIDGCGKLGTLFRIILPLIKAGLAVTTFFIFIGNWNEFFIAGTLLESHATMPVVISMIGMNFGLLSALGLLAMMPAMIIAFALQKFIVTGLTMGTVKG